MGDFDLNNSSLRVGKMAELDVLIPHYNDVAGIAISLNCVARQTWPEPIRVVIADDGSNAGTVRALEELIEKCPFEVHLTRNPINRGRAYTRNVLLDSIDSPYVAWLDAGDAWVSDKDIDSNGCAKGLGGDNRGMEVGDLPL